MEDLEGICDMPVLETLKAGSNKLKAQGLAGLRKLPSLQSLDLSGNDLESLIGPWEQMPSLRSLNASRNKVAAANGFEPMGTMLELREVDVTENPIGEAEDVQVRHELLIFHPRLSMINGEEVTAEEVDQSKELNERRTAEELERKRLEEEAAREAAEKAEAERLERERLEQE